MKKLSLMATMIMLLVSLSLFAQNEKNPFSYKAMYSGESYPKNLRNIQWIPDSDTYSYIVDTAVIVGSITKDKEKVLVHKDEINSAMKEAGYDALTYIPGFEWLGADKIMFEYSNKLFTYDIYKKRIELLLSYTEDANNAEIEHNSNSVAYTKEDNLFVSKDGKEVQITSDGGNGIVNGQTVHRNEFGIEDGIYWSPNGTLLAFYRKDESMVTTYPIVDISPRIAKLDEIRYPMAGMKSEEVTVGIYNVLSGETVFLKTGEPKEQYLTNVTWDPSEKHIYIAVLNRGQDHLKLNKYNVNTGELIKTLFEEIDSRYVEPENGPVFVPGNDNRFLWFSERDGFNHLYQYDTDGVLINQVTSGDWLVNSIVGFDEDANNIYYYSTEESPLEKHLYRISLDGKKKKKLTKIKGTHSVVVQSEGNYFLDKYSNVDGIASEYAIYNATGKLKRIILDNVDPLSDYNMGKTYIGTLNADDGTELYYKMILPPDFDENKKYPVYYYVYGGPHAQLVRDSWLGGANMFLQLLATKGYIVFTLDNRGSANRGFEFESSIHRNVGTLEVADQMVGVNYLKSLAYVDMDRIGIQGWSYGGFMTISLMLNYPGVFKVGMAGGPVIDWKYYEVMYGERYMDTPEENPDGYSHSCLVNKVDSLQGRLMIVHGTNDPVVVWQHSLTFIQKCIKKGKMVDYFVYPGHEHNIRGYDRIHLYKKFEQYMEDFL